MGEGNSGLRIFMISLTLFKSIVFGILGIIFAESRIQSLYSLDVDQKNILVQDFKINCADSRS